MMDAYLYYPGCSVKGTGRAYEESLIAVFTSLGVQLEELDDWNCCGATAYMSIDAHEALTLTSRNLALACQEGRDLMAPCSACYLALNKTQRLLEAYPKIKKRVTYALGEAGLRYGDGVRIRHPLDVLVNDIGLDAIRARVITPLDGLSVAPYYGCQVTRPYAEFDDQYAPTTMDRLLEVTGANVVPYPLKTTCCGGSQTGTIPDVGLELVYTLLKDAKNRGADIIATICPLCQFNLDGYQDRAARGHDPIRIPVVYFTQLLGLALGLPEKSLGLDRGIVPAEPVLAGRTAHV